jgi:putative membrane protein
MWPYMGSMGWWMAVWWIGGIAALGLFVWLIAGMSGARGEEAPELILKRRYARGEIDRDEYQRRLDDLRR